MTSYAEKPTIITLHFALLAEATSAFVAWQAKLNSTIISSPGFVSLEFLSPSETKKEWLVMQRFSNQNDASRWRNSNPYRQLIDQLKQLTINKEVKETLTDESVLLGGVTEVFFTKVHPGKEEAYQQWSIKIHQAEANFPGFRGMYVQSPRQKDEEQGHWITLLQFDTMENLDRWLESDERRKLLNESASLISSLETNRVISPYGGWFASIARIGALPPVWKQTMIILLVLFPIVMIELKYLSPLTAIFNRAVGTFIGNAISVVLIAFPMMPLAIRCLQWWLLPKSNKERHCTIAGTCLVLFLYLAEIAFFWNFL